MNDFAMRFALAALAVWRVSHLLAFEDGPFDLIVRLRAGLGRAGRVLDCFYCLSLWVAAAITPWLASTLQEGWIVWLALAGAAGLAHRFTEPDVESMKG